MGSDVVKVAHLVKLELNHVVILELFSKDWIFMSRGVINVASYVEIMA